MTLSGGQAVQGGRFAEVLTVGQGVQRPVDPVQLGQLEQQRRVRVPQVGLAVLHASEDAQVRESSSAPLDGVQVSGYVQAWRLEDPVRADECAKVIDHVLRLRAPSLIEVQVLGEDHRRQPDLHSTCACPFHRPPCGGRGTSRVPGPFAVNVTVSRKGHRPMVPSVLGRLRAEYSSSTASKARSSADVSDERRSSQHLHACPDVARGFVCPRSHTW